MIGGAFVVAACLLLLGWTIEVVGLFVKAENTVRKHQTFLAGQAMLTDMSIEERCSHSGRGF